MTTPSTAPTPEEIRRNQIKLAIETMAAAGITRVTVSFDGCGDSGQINDIEIEPEGKALPDTPLTWTNYREQWDFPATRADGGVSIARSTVFDAADGKLNDLIEAIVYDLLNFKHPGWEINEGSFGRFDFDVATSELKVEFNQRVETYETETYKIQ